MDELDNEFGTEINFYQLDANVPENEAVQQAYGLRGHPTLVVLDKNNAVTQTYVGPQSEETLQAAITAILP